MRVPQGEHQHEDKYIEKPHGVLPSGNLWVRARAAENMMCLRR